MQKVRLKNKKRINRFKKEGLNVVDLVRVLGTLTTQSCLIFQIPADELQICSEQTSHNFKFNFVTKLEILTGLDFSLPKTKTAKE